MGLHKPGMTRANSHCGVPSSYGGQQPHVPITYSSQGHPAALYNQLKGFKSGMLSMLSYFPLLCPVM